jgi:hypothetical protein
MAGEARQNLQVDLTDLYLAAPAFQRAGDSIGGAVSQAQRQLERLGSFWGNDAPGRTFGSFYAKYQSELLNVLGVTASELKGISDGINHMASNYDIAEQANVKMATRLAKESQW